TGFFLPDSLVKAFAGSPQQAQVQALVNQVRNGVNAYQIKSSVAGGKPIGANALGFKDEWDFHKTMLGLVGGYKTGDFREYSKRVRGVQDAMGAFYTQAMCAQSQVLCSMGLPNAIGLITSHEQTWTVDPFVSRAVYGNVDRTNATNMGAFFQGRPAL